MQKMQARSLADLERMAETLKVPYHSLHSLTEGRDILAVV